MKEKEKSVEAKTLTQDIEEFNRKIDVALGQLTEWKSRLLAIQEEFIEKLKTKTLSMKIK
jgi:hypothetical protein